MARIEHLESCQAQAFKDSKEILGEAVDPALLLLCASPFVANAAQIIRT